MTSQQLQAKLDAAIVVIALCECALADPGAAARKGYDRDVRRAVFDFMDAHRKEQREGGAQ